MKNATSFRLLPLLAGLLLATAPALAQTPGTGGPQPGPDPDPTAVPLDGGAGLLLAGGVAYGLRKLRQRKSR